MVEIININNNIDVLVYPKAETLESIELKNIVEDYKYLQKRKIKKYRKALRYKLLNSMGLL